MTPRLTSSFSPHLDAAVGNLGTMGAGSRGRMTFDMPGTMKRTVLGGLNFRKEGVGAGVLRGR